MLLSAWRGDPCSRRLALGFGAHLFWGINHDGAFPVTSAPRSIGLVVGCLGAIITHLFSAVDLATEQVCRKLNSDGLLSIPPTIPS